MRVKLLIIICIAALLCFCCSLYAADNSVIRYRVESKGGPASAYWTFSDAYHIFKPGDLLEYDVYLMSESAGVGGIDITTRHSMRLRDFHPKDGKGIAADPKADLSPVAYKKWYHRSIKIPSELMGEETAEWLVTVNGIFSTGEMSEAAFKNIRITNKGRTELTVYNGGKLPMNQINFTNEATVESAVLVSCPLSERIRTTTDWFHSTLPENKYIGMHAESYDFTKKQWVSACPTIQPFKSRVFKPWRTAFWRKDDMQDFYGEIFTYDLTTLRLHTETMPSPSPHEAGIQPAWDARPDRSRVFVQTSNGYQNWFTDKTIVYDWDPTCLVRLKTGNAQFKIGVAQNAGENWAIGRAIAPISGTTDWQFHGTLNTYISNNYKQLNDGVAPLIQISINDYVTMTKIKGFSTVYDGEAEGWKADPEFKNFDEAYVINQNMNDNGGRERFIFTRKGSGYFGLARWDYSEFRDGKWVPTGRATGLKLMTVDKGFSFAGMYDRVKNDQWIQPRELDMYIPNPSDVPNVTMGEIALKVQNTGLAEWKSGSTKLHVKLMDASWKPVTGSETELCTVDKNVPTLGDCVMKFSLPREWRPGIYWAVFEMENDGVRFGRKGSVPFVKKIGIPK